MKPILIVTLAAAMFAAPAMARTSHSGSGSSRPVETFRSSACKSAGCMARHPSGTYTHPITSRKRT